MWWREIAIVGVAVACIAAAGAAGEHVSTDQGYDAELTRAKHTCLPLGWKPIATSDGAFVPGTSIEYTENGTWLKPLWLGRIPEAYESNADVRSIGVLLDELVKRGVMQRTMVRHSTQYYLTLTAWHYEFSQPFHGSNPLHLPFLCYSNGAPWAKNDPIIAAHSLILAQPRNHLNDPAAWR